MTPALPKRASVRGVAAVELTIWRPLVLLLGRILLQSYVTLNYVGN
jgi:hypothetical protein